MSDVILSVRDLSVRYGAIHAVREISFDVCEGEIVTLIGANGSGKSSILRAISGIVPYTGEIVFKGAAISRVPPERIVSLGIAHVPEGRGIFANLTVMENLKLAAWTRKDRALIARDLEHVFSLFPRLAERRDQSAGTLSGGEQQMLALGRALMSRSSLMLLDEPSMGLAPVLVREIFRVLKEINREGTTILLIEQNANMALHTASRAHVLESGRIVLSGTGADLIGTAGVREAYLG